MSRCADVFDPLVWLFARGLPKDPETQQAIGRVIEKTDPANRLG
jgi:hypothetical protein